MAKSDGRSKVEPGDTYPNLLSARIGFLLARAHLVAREKADRALEGVGLTMKAYAALATLVSDGPVSQQKLSRRIRMDPATMVDVIDALERSGHIIRRRNPEDRKVVRRDTFAGETLRRAVGGQIQGCTVHTGQTLEGRRSGAVIH